MTYEKASIRPKSSKYPHALIREGAIVGCSSIFLMDLCEHPGEW